MFYRRFRSEPPIPRIVIVVLGDIGRSPRMQYHAQSCGELGWHVDFVGYGGSRPIASLLDAERRGQLRFHFLKSPGDLRKYSRFAFVLRAALRAVFQVFSLLYILIFRCRSTEWILCQTPPAIPTLAAAHLARWATRSNLLLDWHNTSSSVLATKRPGSNGVVRIAESYEKTMARYGGRRVRHIAVSKALRRKLVEEWRVNQPVDVLYDRPAERFRRLTEREAEEFLARFSLLPDNPKNARIVSSTSWTEDEDFDVLLRGLEKYETMAERDPTLPGLSVFISGRGPLLTPFLEKIAALTLPHAVIRTLWLEPEDYPLLLGSCDVGISLHRSSPGLDLPMKIADMLGGGLPVIALGYPALREELVADGRNGLVVERAEDLAAALGRLLENEKRLLERMRSSVLNEYGPDGKRWRREWRTVVAPILTSPPLSVFPAEPT